MGAAPLQCLHLHSSGTIIVGILPRLRTLRHLMFTNITVTWNLMDTIVHNCTDIERLYLGYCNRSHIAWKKLAETAVDGSPKWLPRLTAFTSTRDAPLHTTRLKFQRFVDAVLHSRPSLLVKLFDYSDSDDIEGVFEDDDIV